jgi:hypothetical protein
MAYTITSHVIGPQPIAVTDTTQNHPLGTIVKAKDPTYGEGEFVYLKGLASTAVGEAVIYDQYAGTTKRAVAGDRGPAAIAMSANVASQYGWYQIGGSAVAKTGTVAAAGNVYVTATAGTLDDATVSGDKIDGARFKTADGTPSAGFAIAQLDRPALNGNG